MIQYNISTVSKRPSTSVVEITDIHKACRTGDLPTIKHAYHLDPSKINTKDESLSWTPLFRTVIFGHVKATKFLLKHGAKPNLVNSLGETPLHQAADNSQYIIAELLLKHGADPNKQQSDGDTPLHHAAFRGDSKMIEILLRFGADPNVQNELFKRTPLHFACDCGHEESVMLMMKFNGDSQVPDSQQWTPFQLANTKLQEAINNFSLQGTVIIHPSPIDTLNQDSYPDLPVTALSKWLDTISLSDYYSVFVSVGYESLENLIEQMQSAYPITLKELKKLGILKLGHRCRLIVKLEEDSGVFPPQNFDRNNWKCCGVPRRTQFGINMNSLDGWLEGIKLKELKQKFVESGFDDYSFIVTQMKSRYPMDDTILQEIGISDPDQRSRILSSLNDEGKDKSGILVETSQTKASCEFCSVF